MGSTRLLLHHLWLKLPTLGNNNVCIRGPSGLGAVAFNLLDLQCRDIVYTRTGKTVDT